MDLETKQKIIQRIEEAKRDPIVFIDKFCYTYDPKREPHHLPFRLFEFQKEEIVKKSFEAIMQGEDLFFEKSRDMGVTYTILDVFMWFWKNIPGSNFLLGSRKEAYVDNTKGDSGENSNKEESLFGKLEYTLMHLPPFMLPRGFNFKKHLTYMSLINPENGNVISGESANSNFSRGGRFKAILLDEFAFWDNDSAAWSSTADTSNCRIVVTTPGIRPNTKAERLRFNKDGEQIKLIEIDYKLDPRKDAAWEARERARRSAEDFAREIMRNWKSSVKGRVYDEAKDIIPGNFPYNPKWPLYISWDFGLDGTAIGWWQPNMTNGKMRRVDSFFYSNKPIQYAFPLFGNPIDSSFEYSEEDLLAIELLKVLPRAIHFGDPDVEKRSYQSKTVTSTRNELVKAKIYIQTNTEANQFYVRREKTKLMFQKGVEVNSTSRNEYWLSCIQNARYPQRADTSQATNAITLPIHDWTSHHRTETEYFAVNYVPPQSYEEIEKQFPDENLFDKNGFY